MTPNENGGPGSTAAHVSVRRAAESDLDAALVLFDDVVAWLVATGHPGQWGTEPFSSVPRSVEKVRAALALPEAWVAEGPYGELLGLLALGEPDADIPAADEPETYVRLVVASRRPEARGIGDRLLTLAEERAREAGHRLLRLDCYGGDDEALVRYYERHGYVRAERFEDGGWPVQVMAKWLGATP